MIPQTSMRGRLLRALLELPRFMRIRSPKKAFTRHQSVGGGLPPQGRVTLANRPREVV